MRPDDALELRPACIADLAELDALYSRSYPVLLKADYPPSVMVTAVPLISRAQPGLVASGRLHIALRDGRILGAAGWSRAGPREDGASGRPAHVRHVVTDPGALRQGIGRALMSVVLAEAAADGARVMDCQSTLTAVPFYAALGFRAIRPLTVSLRPGIDFAVIHMQRPL